GYLDTMCRKPTTDRWHLPLQPGIALASQCLLSYVRGTGDFVVDASLGKAEVRTLEHGGGQDESPTAGSFRCRSPLNAGNGLGICTQHRRSEPCAPCPLLCRDDTLSAAHCEWSPYHWPADGPHRHAFLAGYGNGWTGVLFSLPATNFS